MGVGIAIVMNTAKARNQKLRVCQSNTTAIAP